MRPLPHSPRRPFHAFLVATLVAIAFSAIAGAAAAASNRDLAAALLKRADMTRGLCAVLGSDGDLPVELAKASGLLVYVREPDAAAVDELRALADKAGFDIQRLVVEHGVLANLPHADNTVDIVLCT